MRLASAAVSAIQAAVNGDWSGAIFSVVMGAASFFTSSIKYAVDVGKATVFGMSIEKAKEFASYIDTLQKVGSGLYSGVRAAESGDNVMAFLQVLGATATVIPVIQGVGLGGLNEQDFAYKLIETLQDAPVIIHNGIQAIENDDWLTGLNIVLDGAASIGFNLFANSSRKGFFTELDKFTDNLGQWINTHNVIKSAIEEGGLHGLLFGINGVLGIRHLQKYIACPARVSRHSQS